MDRRSFLKNAGAAVAAAAAVTVVRAEDPKEPAAERPLEMHPPTHHRHVVYPLQTDFAGLQLMDLEAARKYRSGWWDQVGLDYPGGLNGLTGEQNEEAFERMLREENVRFAKTVTGGWVTSNATLGYNPRDRYWTFYEYDEIDIHEIFGRLPRRVGYDAEEPLVCWHFTKEDAEKHRAHCEKHQYQNRPEIHTA